MVSDFDIREIIISRHNYYWDSEEIAKKLNCNRIAVSNKFRQLRYFDDIEIYYANDTDLRKLGKRTTSRHGVHGYVARKGKGNKKIRHISYAKARNII